MTIECNIVTLVSTHTLSFIFEALVGVVARVCACKILERRDYSCRLSI